MFGMNKASCLRPGVMGSERMAAGPLRRSQLKPELLLKSLEQRRTARIRRAAIVDEQPSLPAALRYKSDRAISLARNRPLCPIF